MISFIWGIKIFVFLIESTVNGYGLSHFPFLCFILMSNQQLLTKSLSSHVLKNVFLFQSLIFLIVFIFSSFLMLVSILIVQPCISSLYNLKYIFIKKYKIFKVLWHFVHALQNYPKLNNEHHTKPSNLYVC